MGAPRMSAEERERRIEKSKKKGYRFDEWYIKKNPQYLFLKDLRIKTGGRFDPNTSRATYEDGTVAVLYNAISTRKNIDDDAILTKMEIKMRKKLLLYLNRNNFKDSIVVVDRRWTRSSDGTGFEIQLYFKSRECPSNDFMHNLENEMLDWDDILASI